MIVFSIAKCFSIAKFVLEFLCNPAVISHFHGVFADQRNTHCSDDYISVYTVRFLPEMDNRWQLDVRVRMQVLEEVQMLL